MERRKDGLRAAQARVRAAEMELNAARAGLKKSTLERTFLELVDRLKEIGDGGVAWPVHKGGRSLLSPQVPEILAELTRIVDDARAVAENRSSQS